MYSTENAAKATISGIIFTHLLRIKYFTPAETLKRIPHAAPKATQAKRTKI